VRRITRAGADWIKVAVTGSVTQGVRAHHSQITPEEMTALVGEAQRQGRAGVMAHAHGARAAEEAARCGARSIEHGILLDEAAVAAMSAAGAWLVPTPSCTQADPDEHVAAAHRASVRLALDADVPIAMGTDNPVRPHTDLDVNDLASRVRQVWHNGAAVMAGAPAAWS
jgi:imidazolonepropionase-like amidohydrolase